jgi:hypothetical protein
VFYSRIEQLKGVNFITVAVLAMDFSVGWQTAPPRARLAPEPGGQIVMMAGAIVVVAEGIRQWRRRALHRESTLF